MKDSGAIVEKMKSMFAKKQTERTSEADIQEMEEVEEGGNMVVKVISVIGRVIFRLRKVFMAIPVVYYALKLADYNTENLPETVGINLQSSGEYAQMITREAAVMGPLAVTAACLLLMFCSRKSVYPWIISIFTLVLPLLILITNNYPA